jgi:galactokinase
VEILKKRYPEIVNLRDVSTGMLDQAKEDLSEVTYRRCRYVTGENERLLRGCELLEVNDLEGFGRLMYQTHQGLSEDYEVSCPELDFLVSLARQRPEVAGARMMGGGFGGCTINVVAADQLDAFSRFVEAAYQKRYDKTPDIYVTQIEDGTRVAG